jgi:hypothetical protein
VTETNFLFSLCTAPPLFPTTTTNVKTHYILLSTQPHTSLSPSFSFYSRLFSYRFFLTCFSMSLNSIINLFLRFSGTGNFVP